ncbi:uncharacterized protein [Euphorbia lathyris]|uniref:uncharacterized protein n=1 Tax=Euphorbia lathyris TaxID=212925 RepID=UPI003313FEEA
MSTNTVNSTAGTPPNTNSNLNNTNSTLSITDTNPNHHPSLTVSNISTFIKITLDIEKGHYPTWAALFKLHATAFQVLDHILPPSPTDPSADTLKQSNPALWTRIDAVVLQWIYNTISLDLLHTIIVADSTAAGAWSRLQEIFSDNKNSRALFLQQEFSKTKLSDYSDISTYSQHLKSLSDQLSNVDCPVTNDQMVLQLISGLTDAYDTVGTQIRHGDPLPTFQRARSMLILEETACARKILPPSESVALTVSSGDTAIAPPQYSSSRPAHHRGSSSYRGGRHGGRPYRGRGGRHHHRSSQPPHYRPAPIAPWGYTYPWAPPQQWASPPCPYPTSGRQPSGSGILGPRPPMQQAHLNMEASSYVPTDIAEAMHTMTIAPPSDQWHMDTGATSHMTADKGFTDGHYYHEM